MKAAAILDFWNLKFLTVERDVSVELYYQAKFRGARSDNCRDIAIRFFKMAAGNSLLGEDDKVAKIDTVY